MRRCAPALLLAVGLAAGVGRADAFAPGAWQTFIRPGEFTDLLALPDAVWGTTAEGGLLRYARATGAFEVVRREPGSIASNQLTRVAIDRSGRLWVATRAHGVSRRSADGARWDVVNRLDGLPSDSVSALEPQRDTLWIGTSGGVALWNGREVAGSLPDGITVSFDTTFASVSITGVAVIGDSLWLATRRGTGYAHLSALLADWRPANQGLGSTDVQDLASDGRDLFARAGAIVYRYRSDLGQWVAENLPGSVTNLEDDFGVVLAASGSGVLRWGRAPVEEWTVVGDALALAPGAAEDPEPTVDESGAYFAAAAEVLYEQAAMLPPVSDATGRAASGPPPWIAHPAPEGPPGNDLVQVAPEGPRVYVTTVQSGVGRYDGVGWRNWLPGSCAGAGCDTTFINPQYTYGLLLDGRGRKWVACWSQALDSFDDAVSPPRFTHHVIATDLAAEKLTWVIVAAQDSSGGRWFGMDTPLKGDIDPLGLTAYDSLGGFMGQFDPGNSTMSGKFVHALTVSRNGRVWVGYDGQGLDFFTPPADHDAFLHIMATDNLAVRGADAHGDSVWILTDAALWRFTAGAGPTSPPDERRPVSGGQAQLGVRPLAVDADGAVWLATRAAGLKVIHPGGAQDSFNVSNSALPDDEVRAIAVDPRTGVVWMTTPAGLARYDPRYVPPPPPPLPALHVRLYPNPATLTGLGIPLRLAGEAGAYEGEICDLGGRRLRRFRTAGNGLVIWDGRDEGGRPVKPGIYFVRARAGGRTAVARVVLLR